MTKKAFLLSLCFLLSINLNGYVFAETPSNQETTISKLKNKITKVQLVQDNNSSKIVLDLMFPLEKLPPIMATLETVSFEVNADYEETKKSIWNILSKKQELDNEIKPTNLFNITQEGFVKKVTWKKEPNKTLFEIKRPYYTPVNLISQEKPPALVLELPRKFFNKETSYLKPGIKRHLIRTVNNRGPVIAHVLEIDLSRKNISVKVGFPDEDKIKFKDTLSNIVKKKKAYAGINANYFDVKVGNPLGTLITDSTWLIGPVYDRAAIGFSKDNMVYIDQVMLLGDVTIYRGFRKKPFSKFEIDGLNIPFSLYKKVGLYTLNWDNKIVLPKDKVGVIVRDDNVKKISSDIAEIPKDGYVLVSDRKYVLNYLKKKDHLGIVWNSTPDWSDIAEAVSGGPYLIKNGEVFVDLHAQHFKFANKDTYAPRSAAGVDNAGNLFLIAVDGRRSGYSVGVTLQELAEMLNKLNLKNAINLDGGGSTTLVVDKKIINTLSERHERKISNALLIYYKD